MNIDLKALTSAITHASATANKWINKRSAQIRQLPECEIDGAQRKLFEDYRGIYARRDLFFDKNGLFLFEHWNIGIGHSFRDAVKISDEFLASAQSATIAALVVEKWDEKYDCHVERTCPGIEHLSAADAAYIAKRIAAPLHTS
ncbi:MAG: hypothetical protein JJ979_03705 [Roseibium sp.]|nr:hypothetical protein [Roseibium sp.]